MNARELIRNRGRLFLAVASLAAAAATTGCLADAGDLQGDEVTETGALSGFTVVTRQTAVSTLATRQLRVVCPTGLRVLDAGWGVVDSTLAIMEGVATYSAPSADGASWLVRARPLTPTTTPWRLQVRALCGSASLAGYQVVAADTDVSTFPVKQINASCPAGKVVTGGGFGVLSGTNGVLEGRAQYFLPGFDGAGWLMNATKTAASASAWKLRGWAVCVNSGALPGYQVVLAETPGNTDGFKQLEAKCPAGKHATGAGWGVLDPTQAILDGDATYFLAGFDGASWLTNARNNNTSFSPSWNLRIGLICTN